MNEKLKIIVLKALLYGYAEITKDMTEDRSKDEFFYKHTLEIIKYFKKNKPTLLSKSDRVLVDKVYRKFVSFDAEYFTDKDGSPYLCMLSILIYLIREKNDLILKSKFGHYDYDLMLRELARSNTLRGVHFDTEKYITAVLNKLDM